MVCCRYGVGEQEQNWLPTGTCWVGRGAFTAQAERFITLMLREPFDYTHWQQQLWAGRSVDKLSKLYS